MSDADDEYEVGSDPEDDAAVMLEAAEADLEYARAEIASLNKSLAVMTEARYAERDRLLEAVRVARTALDKAHACPTLRNDGTCDGCHVQDALTLLTPTGAAPTDGGAK